MRWRWTSCLGATDAMQISWIIWRFKNCYISLFQQSGRGITHDQLAKRNKNCGKHCLNFLFCFLLRWPSFHQCLIITQYIPTPAKVHLYWNYKTLSNLINAEEVLNRKRVPFAAYGPFEGFSSVWKFAWLKALTVGARCCDNVFETLRGFRFHLFRRDLLRTDRTFMIIRVWADNACNKEDTFFVFCGLSKK